MNELLKVLLSLSLSGSLLILCLFLCKPLFKEKISKQWQYYIWLVVIARLLLPFAPETNLMASVFSQIDAGISQSEITTQSQQDNTGADFSPNEMLANPQGGIGQSKANMPVAKNALTMAIDNIWLVWLIVAVAMFIHKLTVYQSFVKYIKAGQSEVSDIELWERIGKLMEQSRVKRPVSLYTNNLISSPLLVGFFRPCIMLPTVELSASDFEYTILHELTHYKRRDMFYKWLVQIVIWVHWFNPLVYLMGREINRACELSCDEAVIRKLDNQGRRIYGDTLLNAVGVGGRYKDAVASVTLYDSQKLLKERLDAIMKYQKAKKWTVPIVVLFSICLLGIGFTLGAYTAQPVAEKTQDEQLVLSGEGLPIMNAQNRTLYETYLQPILVTGILYSNFSPEDISELLQNGGDGLLTLVAVLEGEKMKEHWQDGKVEVAFVDEVLTKRFPLRAEIIHDVCADIYDEASNSYIYAGGLGGGPSISVVTGSSKTGNLLTIYYTWYVGDPSADDFRYMADVSGELIIDLSGSDFKYLSNKVIPATEPQSLTVEG